jgi:hypothetical protein
VESEAISGVKARVHFAGDYVTSKLVPSYKGHFVPAFP